LVGPRCAVSGWDLRTGERVVQTELAPGAEDETAFLITRDGERLLRARGETLRLQSIATGATLATGTGWLRYGVCRASPDGSVLAISSDRGPIRILSGTTLAPIAELTGHKNIIHGLAFSEDGHWLASASIDSKAIVWDLRATPPTPIILEHPAGAECVAFSRDATLVATTCSDLAIRVWEARSGALKGVYSSGRLNYSSLMFMPDGRTVAGRQLDGTVRFWDVTADATVNLQGHRGLVNGAAFAGPAGLVVSAGWDGWKGIPGCLKVWDSDTGEELAAIGERGEVAYRLAVSPDGRYAAASITRTDTEWTPRDQVQHNRLELIDLRTGQRRRIESGRPAAERLAEACSLAFDPAGTQLAIGRNGGIEVRSAADGSVLRSRETGFEGRTGTRFAWSPDARLLACTVSTPGGNWGELLLIDAATLNTERKLDLPDVSAVAFAPGGTVLCAGSADGTVRLVSPGDGRVVRTIPAHNDFVSSVAFSPDGSRLATAGGNEGDVVVWDTSGDHFDRVARFHENDFVASVAWSADGRRLIGACGTTVRIWDSTPLRERVKARDERKAALEALRAQLPAWCADPNGPASAVKQIEADGSLSPLGRRVALQEVFRANLQR
jgi:WD40 repeat protein